jgi:hypothetical protein
VPPIAITKNTQYWIAVLAPAGGASVTFATVQQGAQAQLSAQKALLTLPVTWTRGAYVANAPMSAYGAQAP